MALSLVTAPTDEPVELEIAKAHCRVTFTDDDGFFEDELIPTARDRAELTTQRQLIEATWDLKLEAFPCDGWIDIPKPPLIAVVSVTYVDTAGVAQTWAASNYLVSIPVGARCRRGRLTPAYGVSWPSTRAQMDAVTVRFKAGYGTQPADVPKLLMRGLLLDIGTLYADREDLVIGATAVELPGRSRQIYQSFKSHAPKRAA
jgi:uncharacterized phiE125 gp8 family phage protein